MGRDQGGRPCRWQPPPPPPPPPPRRAAYFRRNLHSQQNLAAGLHIVAVRGKRLLHSAGQRAAVNHSAQCAAPTDSALAHHVIPWDYSPWSDGCPHHSSSQTPSPAHAPPRAACLSTCPCAPPPAATPQTGCGTSRAASGGRVKGGSQQRHCRMQGGAAGINRPLISPLAVSADGPGCGCHNVGARQRPAERLH